MHYHLIFDDIIIDRFMYADNEIVVLDNDILGEPNNLLLLGKITHGIDASYVVPVAEEEYKALANYYVDLCSAFMEDEVEND